MRSSYKQEDVTLLLKDITGLVEPQPTEERERQIQAGRHYCEMLPIEYVPSEKYMEVYREALDRYSGTTALAVGRLSDKIMEARGKDVVLVSLARAGIPIGILVKHYIRKKYGVEAPHYAISIIRGRGIDDNAMRYLLDRYRPEQILFVDGWIGKGAILGEMEKDMAKYPGVSPEIAVAADPANITALCGTHEDILIPSSCLNCTVSGLISRTFLREDIIGKDDFHGAVYYGELREADLSYEFIDAIEAHFCTGGKRLQYPADGKNLVESQWEKEAAEVSPVKAGKTGASPVKVRREEMSRTEASRIESGQRQGSGADEVKELARVFGIADINLIKPGIGETTRVLLRRVPWKVLIDENYKGDAELAHIVRLALEKNVPIEYYPLTHYKCCGMIKKLADT